MTGDSLYHEKIFLFLAISTVLITFNVHVTLKMITTIDDVVIDNDDGLPAYSHQVGICHYAEGWENDMYKSAIYI